MTGSGAVAKGARQQAGLVADAGRIAAGGPVPVRGGGVGVGGRTRGWGAVVAAAAEEGVALGCGLVVDGGRGGLGLGVAGEERHVGGCLCVCVCGFVVVGKFVRGEDIQGLFCLRWFVDLMVDEDEDFRDEETAALAVLFLLV